MVGPCWAVCLKLVFLIIGMGKPKRQVDAPDSTTGEAGLRDDVRDIMQKIGLGSKGGTTGAAKSGAKPEGAVSRRDGQKANGKRERKGQPPSHAFGNKRSAELSKPSSGSSLVAKRAADTFTSEPEISAPKVDFDMSSYKSVFGENSKLELWHELVPQRALRSNGVEPEVVRRARSKAEILFEHEVKYFDHKQSRKHMYFF